MVASTEAIHIEVRILRICIDIDSVEMRWGEVVLFSKIGNRKVDNHY